MSCDDDQHVFWPGTHQQVLRCVAEGRLTSFLFACARCHEGLDLLADELRRREAPQRPAHSP